MSQNEIITLTFSGIAILVSLITSYYQFFWKQTKANFRLVWIQNNEGRFDRKYCYVISNPGNQELLLNSIHLLTGNSDKGMASESYGGHDIESSDYPKVIKVGEIAPVNICINSDVYEKLDEHNKKVFIMFEFVSVNGRKKEFLHDITAIGENHSKEEMKVWESNLLKGFKD
jgi:hypothetical protein